MFLLCIQVSCLLWFKVWTMSDSRMAEEGHYKKTWVWGLKVKWGDRFVRTLLLSPYGNNIHGHMYSITYVQPLIWWSPFFLCSSITTFCYRRRGMNHETSEFITILDKNHVYSFKMGRDHWFEFQVSKVQKSNFRSMIPPLV